MKMCFQWKTLKNGVFFESSSETLPLNPQNSTRIYIPYCSISITVSEKSRELHLASAGIFFRSVRSCIERDSESH